MMLSAVSGIVEYFWRLYKSLCRKFDDTFVIMWEYHPAGTRMYLVRRKFNDQLENPFPIIYHPELWKKEKEAEGNFGAIHSVPCACCRFWKVRRVRGARDNFGEEMGAQCLCCGALRVARVSVRKRKPDLGLCIFGRCTPRIPEDRIVVKGLKRGA